MNKLGIYEKAIPLQYSWDKKFQIARDSGYDFIEFSIDGLMPRIQRLKWSNEEYRRIREIAEEYGMPFYSMALTANRYYPLGDDDDNIRDKGISIVKRAIEIATILDIKIIQLATYDVNGKISTDETKQRFFDSISLLADIAYENNVILALEVLEDVPHFSKIEQGVQFIKKMNHPAVKLYADPGNTASIGIDNETDLKFDQGEVICVHMKDAITDNCRNIMFGEGIVDFESCFRHFKERNYTGPYIVEMWSDEDESFIPVLSQASEFIRKYL